MCLAERRVWRSNQPLKQAQLPRASLDLESALLTARPKPLVKPRPNGQGFSRPIELPGTITAVHAPCTTFSAVSSSLLHTVRRAVIKETSAHSRVPSAKRSECLEACDCHHCGRSDDERPTEGRDACEDAVGISQTRSAMYFLTRRLSQTLSIPGDRPTAFLGSS